MPEAKQPNSDAKSKSTNNAKSTVNTSVKSKPSTVKTKNARTGNAVKKTTKKVTTNKATVKPVVDEVTLTETATLADKPVQQTVSPPPTAPAQPAVKPSSGKGIAWFAILLSLGALAGSGFTWYQTQVQQVQSNSSLAVGVSDIGGQVARLGDSMARLQQQQASNISVEQASTKLKDGLQPLQFRQDALDESIQKISIDLQKGVNAFVVEEVSQLLKLANHSVNFTGNTASAIQALSLADGQLKQLTDPRYSKVRTKINEEIVQLKNVQKVDVEGLSAQLSSISSLVPSLPLANEPTSKPVDEVVEADEPMTWRTELNKVWGDVKDVIKIQRIDQPPKPLLVPEQRYFLNQNLQLNLSKAELALMQSKSALFQQNLKSSVTWLNEYFDLKDDRVNAVLTQLAELQGQTLDIQLPDISGSFDTLQTILGR